MKVHIIDWLGRGGIAQCSESWALTLLERGVEVELISRRGREIGQGAIPVSGPDLGANRVLSHRALAEFAAKRIHEDRPDAVVIQNYVLPVLESAPYRAAQRVGARTIGVIHDDHLHSWAAGTTLGLSRLMDRCDVVVTHSRYVAAGLQRYGNRAVVTIPHPVQLSLLQAERMRLGIKNPGELLGIHFGILHRRYKGTDVATELAKNPAPGWAVALLGRGAPRVPGVVSVDRFLSAGELVGSIAESDAVILPYRMATQSGAVVLAQLLGSVPIASNVGGISEQISDGVTGRLIPPSSAVAVWRDALAELSDPRYREEIATASVAHVWSMHEVFVKAILDLCAGR